MGDHLSGILEEFLTCLSVYTLDKGLDQVKTGFLLSLSFFDSWVYICGVGNSKSN